MTMRLATPKTKANYDDTKLADLQAALDKTRTGVEAKADELNKKYGKPVVFLVPVGDATVKLRALVQEGKYPGVTRQSELWTDAMPHPGAHVMALSAYPHFAAIYRTSPIGLKMPRFKEKLAWETVSKYPYAGVTKAKYPFSKKAKVNMFRSQVIAGILSFCGFLAWTTGVSAEEPKRPAVAEKPVGLRVISGGHSWSTENSAPLCQAAGIAGHMKLNKQGLNSGRIEDLTPLLEKGEIDVYVWQHSGVGRDSPAFLPTLVELGPKHNPNFRVHIQLPWLVHDGRQGVKLPEEYEKTDLAEYQTKLEKSRKQAEDYVDAVNAKAGKRIVFLVPLADGMLEVRKMIVAGKFPGITKQNYRDKPGDRGSVLGGDIMPHQGHLGMRLGAFMHFAALYRMSPEGLKFPGKEGDGLTDDQRAVLQKLAWEMVSKYPYAGIAKYEASSPSKDGKKPAPVPGATAVPEALKGWKATQDLPDDTVVTDYNAYIEKLPKAERPGVSDVKYYVDGTGRYAVAVLVNVDGNQWTHLVVYDKQNKRTGVTKFVSGR
jgi:hypothetical protein